MTMFASRRPRRASAALVLCAGLLLAVPPLLAAAPAANAAASDAQGYRLPSAALQAVVDAPRAPTLRLSPRRDLAAMLQTPPLPSIAQVAQPELKLAGLRINPRTFSDSRFSFGSRLWLISTADGAERQISGLPQPLSVASLAWSPDQKYLAFNQVDPASGSNELWLVDVAAGSARRVAERLNSVVGNGYAWLPGGAALLVMQRPAGQGAAPVGDGIPTGPAVQQTEAGRGVRSVRTYQDLLKNDHDARLFEYYLQAQPVRVAINGESRPLGMPGLYLGLSSSPDGNYLLSQRVERPFSYAVPVGSFPAPYRGAGRAGPGRAHGGQAAAGRRPAHRQRRGADRSAFDLLARRRAGHPGLGRSAGWRRSGARGGDPRRGAGPGRAVRPAAGDPGAPGRALCRHQLGPWRRRPAQRVLVEDAPGA